MILQYLAGVMQLNFKKDTVDVVYTKDELDMPRPNHFGETNGDLKRGLELSYVTMRK